MQSTRAFAFAFAFATNAVGKCLYISGVPGTGKSATVREIIRVLRSQARRGNAVRSTRCADILFWSCPHFLPRG
jgi:Cdc6-like AAA superfamily ATPase